MIDGSSPEYLARFHLHGRLALVTGGGSGLGRVFSMALADAGAFIAVCDVDETSADETVAAIRDRGGRGEVYRVDIADSQSVNAMAEALRSRGRPLDILVNNAGISTRSLRVHEIPPEEWEHVIAINLTGTFLVTRALIPLMLPTRSGSIINIASTVGLEGLDASILAQAGYAASKAGVIGLTRQLAVEYGPDGLRANAIAPGWHLGTRLGERVGNFRTPAEFARLNAFIRDHTPLRRAGSPHELAGLVLYLASDASSYVTGQVIAHDGGWTVW